jgi:hypothetical protein
MKDDIKVIFACKHRKKCKCDYELYRFTAHIDGAPHELFEFTSHSCETVEYHTGLSRKQRDAMDLAMKISTKCVHWARFGQTLHARSRISMGAMLRQRAPMWAVFSPGFYGGPSQYLWGPFSILSMTSVTNRL